MNYPCTPSQYLARRTDPATSHNAAAKVPTFKAKHEAAIYAAICDCPKFGATAKEIAIATGLTDVQVNRRLADMGRRRLIERNAHMDCSGFWQRNGCCVWYTIHGR